jgi:hypothetical protein
LETTSRTFDDLVDNRILVFWMSKWLAHLENKNSGSSKDGKNKVIKCPSQGINRAIVFSMKDRMDWTCGYLDSSSQTLECTEALEITDGLEHWVSLGQLWIITTKWWVK